MLQNRQPPFRPLVVGAPRSGFALLASVVIHFVPLAPAKEDLKQLLLNLIVYKLGYHVSSAIVRGFAARGVTADLLYNPNFRLLIGGPKWLDRRRPDFACFRKYIGVRGKGDFTLNTSHPLEVLDAYKVVHSHTDPGLWVFHPRYGGYTRYASIRNPVGIINSSVFSLNALASEYIQKFVPPEKDNDVLRQQLALYKFTDTDFVEGLVRFLVNYLTDFVKFKHHYHLMKWEDLILTPVPTIVRLAEAAGISVSEAWARDLWNRLDHVNLTGHHRHNYRAGKGIVGDWRNSVVNEHLEMMKGLGLEPLMIELGYGPIEYLDESAYTLFQKTVKSYLDRGEVWRDCYDQDLFTFAFNKSNLQSDKFPFRRYEWREWTQVERSIFTDEELEQTIWNIAERATSEMNAFLQDTLQADFTSREGVLRQLHLVWDKHRCTLGRDEVPYAAVLTEAEKIVKEAVDAGGGGFAAARWSPDLNSQDEPQLVDSVEGYNVVRYRAAYYCVPKSLGDVRLERDDVSQLGGVMECVTFEEAIRAIGSAACGSQTQVSSSGRDNTPDTADLKQSGGVP